MGDGRVDDDGLERGGEKKDGDDGGWAGWGMKDEGEEGMREGEEG